MILSLLIHNMKNFHIYLGLLLLYIKHISLQFDIKLLHITVKFILIYFMFLLQIIVFSI